MKRRRWMSLSLLFAITLTFTALERVAEAKKKRRPATPNAVEDSNVTTTPVARGGGWMKRQEQINARIKQGNVDLIFIGDSITQGWERSGKKVWDQFYGKRNAANLGIDGDETQHVLWRLDHGNIDGIKPKLAVVMIGTNNSGSNTPQQIADGITAIVKKLQNQLPETKILLLSIFPRGTNDQDKLRKVNEATNEIIANLADNKTVYHLDIGPKLLEPDGKTLSKDTMPDLLHPNEKGYQIWAEAIEPTVKQLMGE